MFFFPLTKKSRARYAVAKSLLTSSIAQSRQPIFYTTLAVPDTFNGRFELVALHVGMAVTELTQRDGDNVKLAQALFDEMFLNLEQACRSVGVGDLAVPKHIKRMMKALKGRAFTYSEAIKNGDLGDALARNLYGTIERPNPTILNAVSTYVQAYQVSLKTQTLDAGIIEFPVVDTTGVVQDDPLSQAA